MLDIGCNKGELLLKASGKISSGTGIDPHCETGTIDGNIQLIKGRFPDELPPGKTYSCITMLAVLEHIPAKQQLDFLKNCFNQLEQGGLLIITVPDENADKVLARLKKMKLISATWASTSIPLCTPCNSLHVLPAGNRCLPGTH